MGQKASHQQVGGDKKLPFSLFPRKIQTTHLRNPEQPIRFQYKRRNDTKQNVVNHQNNQLNNLAKSDKNSNVDVKCRLVKTQNATLVGRARSEPSLLPEKRREKYTRHRRKSAKIKNNWNEERSQQFGYDIRDVDEFLTKATIEKPANIPVVLAFPSVLYQTRIGGYQAEIWLPLGMVVNAVFKNQHWLYVQTPHAEEGYVSYAACLPLGIIPPADDDKPTPCWEKSSDVFPRPSGNMTDTEKLSSKSDCDSSIRFRLRPRQVSSSCGEKSVDKLYLRATSISKCKNHDEATRQTLLVIGSDFQGSGENDYKATKGEVVFLLDANVKGWFYVKNKEGREGYIPAAIAGHGFL